jgi:GTP pyrophosphokinase
MFDPERRIDVAWSDEAAGGAMYDVKLELDVEDRQGLLAKIVSAVSDEKTNIKNVEATTFGTADARIVLVVEVADHKQLERVTGRLRKIKGVRAVERLLR